MKSFDAIHQVVTYSDDYYMLMPIAAEFGARAARKRVYFSPGSIVKSIKKIDFARRPYTATGVNTLFKKYKADMHIEYYREECTAGPDSEGRRGAKRENLLYICPGST
ncbi:hypothetical protein OUZ56_000879 [Daphnia magna]|uniref:Uncharacterized protein n=1 Tax=Daphnia magna TaxID=35525 RepID=A0ABR0A1K8_9CRUS|nr:hypothetical protein OUZ56_000879 [Daphnia magna]